MISSVSQGGSRTLEGGRGSAAAARQSEVVSSGSEAGFSRQPALESMLPQPRQPQQGQSQSHQSQSGQMLPQQRASREAGVDTGVEAGVDAPRDRDAAASEGDVHGTHAQRLQADQPRSKQAASAEGLDAQGLWQAVLDRHGQRAAFGWLRALAPGSYHQGSFELSLRPGQREMVKFFGDRQRQQLAQMLGEAAGRPVKVSLSLATHGDGQSGDASSADQLPGEGERRGVMTAAQRQAAMDLPLVRELLESFDLSLVEVRQAGEADASDAAIAAAAAADDDDEGQDDEGFAAGTGEDALTGDDAFYDGMDETMLPDDFDS